MWEKPQTCCRLTGCVVLIVLGKMPEWLIFASFQQTCRVSLHAHEGLKHPVNVSLSFSFKKPVKGLTWGAIWHHVCSGVFWLCVDLIFLLIWCWVDQTVPSYIPWVPDPHGIQAAEQLCAALVGISLLFINIQREITRNWYATVSLFLLRRLILCVIQFLNVKLRTRQRKTPHPVSYLDTKWLRWWKMTTQLHINPPSS